MRGLRLGLSLTGGSPTFDPATLFAGAQQGAWYDPSDLGTLYQSGSRAAPGVACAVGDPVGLMLDKSGNNWDATQSSTSRPILRNSGALYWLEFDGVDDMMIVAATNTFPATDASGFNGCAAGVSFTLATGMEYLFSVNGAYRQDVRKNVAALENLITNPDANVDTGPAISAATPCVVSATIGASNALIVKKDGVSDGTTTATGTLNSGNAGFHIGALSGTANFLNGNFYGALWVSRQPSASELASMETWAGSKCGVTI